MKKFLVLITTIFLILLSSCSKTDIENEDESGKREFLIDVKNITDFDNIATIKKT
jgi:hypothetical protein